MDRRTSGKIASIMLLVLGFIEVSGAVMLFVLPHEFITSSGIQLPWELVFAASLSAIFGLSRLVAGYAVWLMKKWGIVLGVILSTITLIVVPLAYKAGVIGIVDMLLAIIALASLLYCWFGNGVINQWTPSNSTVLHVLPLFVRSRLIIRVRLNTVNILPEFLKYF